MTAIVGLVKDGIVYIGGDSATVSSTRLTSYPVKDDKVFINGKFIFGFTTSWRMGQLLQYSFKPPKKPKGMSVKEYMHTRFIDAVRTCFKDGGFAEIDNNVEDGGSFLVGYKGELFEIHDDFQLMSPAQEYAAVGCGDLLCMGSLHSTSHIMEPEQRITMALSAAAHFSGGVKPPFTIKKL
jgi:hypothetical protein